MFTNDAVKQSLIGRILLSEKCSINIKVKYVRLALNFRRIIANLQEVCLAIIFLWNKTTPYPSAEKQYK